MANPWKELSVQQAQQWQQSQIEGVEGFRLHLKRAGLWDIIQRHLPAALDARILDLGAGTGLWSIRLALEGYRVWLTDVSEGMLQQAHLQVQQHGLADRVTIEQIDMVDLSRYTDESFDQVLAVGAPLSYATDPARAVREAFRVTKPQGVFIGDAENRYAGALFRRRAMNWADAKQILLEGIGRWRDEGPAAAIRMFTPPEVRELLTVAGWQVLEMYASDMVESLVHQEVIEEIARQPALFGDVLEVEKRLRQEPYLLASGRDIQFVARKG